jgi:Peptidase family M1 domain
MVNTKKAGLLMFLMASINCFGQNTLPVPLNIQNTYNRGTRSPSGLPGKNYWQNYADYSIKINFNPESRNLNGTVFIDYTNNSPDTLRQVIFKLYPNLYKNGAVRNMPILSEDETSGVQIERLKIDQQDQNPRQWKIDGTEMAVNTRPVPPKQKIHFEIAYSYTVNKTSHIRTGQVDSGAFFIAYFYPRIAVYDDIDGWNRQPYLGIQEFYNDFCHFYTEITVPGNYGVWATGNLKNAIEVYTDKIVKRIKEATASDKVTNVITDADINDASVTLNKPTNTWKFEADSVTDFAFAISNHYLWKSTSIAVDVNTNRRVRVDAVFNADHKSYFNVINYARKTVEAMSYQFPKWPYPFPHETIFDGLDQMEYPMMVNDAPYEKEEDNIELTDHEIFHSMFPFYMGINETKYAWMDEGWATIGEWTISALIDSKITDLYAISDYEKIAGKEEDVPITTLSTFLYGAPYQTNSYPKPALGYRYLKDMLGDELFTKAMHYYIAHWHGKHPMPYDFFNCINAGADVNLNWFWRSWFFDRGEPDQAITKVTANKKEYTVIVTNVGTKPIPVDLSILYTDGTTFNLHQSVACWKNGNKTITLNFKAKKVVERIVLGNGYDPDINKADNIWINSK